MWLAAASAALGPPSSSCSASALSAASVSGTSRRRGRRWLLAQAIAPPQTAPATKAAPSEAKTPTAARLQRHADHEPAQAVHADANYTMLRLAALCTIGCAAAACMAVEAHAPMPTPPPHALPSARNSTTGQGSAAPGTIASMERPLLSAGTTGSEVGARKRGAAGTLGREVWNVRAGAN